MNAYLRKMGHIPAAYRSDLGAVLWDCKTQEVRFPSRITWLSSWVSHFPSGSSSVNAGWGSSRDAEDLPAQGLEEPTKTLSVPSRDLKENGDSGPQEGTLAFQRGVIMRQDTTPSPGPCTPGPPLPRLQSYSSRPEPEESVDTSNQKYFSALQKTH